MIRLIAGEAGPGKGCYQPEIPDENLFVTKGDLSFSIGAPTLRNSFPPALRHITSLDNFKSLLETVLFQRAFAIVLLIHILFYSYSLFCNGML